MNRLIGYIKAISLRLRWLFMSPKERYPYLWAITRKMGGGGSAVRYAVAIVNR